MTEQQIMKDLKDIKGYFTMINHIKRSSSVVAPIRIMEVVERYKRIIEQAGSDEFVIFSEMYINGATQADLAAYWGVSRETVKYRHKKFIKYLLEIFEKEEN